eukprot:1855743-Pleurochrysis_carterae.AAC.2
MEKASCVLELIEVATRINSKWHGQSACSHAVHWLKNARTHACTHSIYGLVGSHASPVSCPLPLPLRLPFVCASSDEHSCGPRLRAERAHSVRDSVLRGEGVKGGRARACRVDVPWLATPTSATARATSATARRAGGAALPTPAKVTG